MRRYFLPFLIFFHCALVAQQDSVSTFAFGFGVGYYSNSIELTNTTRQEYDVLPLDGLQIGASVRYFNNKSVGFVGELNYTQSGWKEQEAEDTPVYQRNNGYLECQLLTQVAIGRKLIRPMLQAGPYFSFPISQQDEVAADFSIPAGDNYYGSKLPFRPNYGLVVGGGLYIQVAQIGIQLEGRYLIGLSDLIRSGQLGVTTSRRQAIGARVTIFYEL